jgi:hypothetical protein
LVVFGDTALIWQIKNPKLHGGKYKESEVKRNIDQLITAKNRLLSGKVKITLSNPRRGSEEINPANIKRVYLISALVGEPEEYFSFFETIKGEGIHIFNREFLELSIRELDTISDFIQYLHEKERVLSKVGSISLNGGEKELLATYLGNERSLSQLDGMNFVYIEDGCWDNLIKKPEYIRKKEADKVSYGWDSMIDWAHTAGEEYERIARELARSNRFERRCLSKAFYEARVLANTSVPECFRRLARGVDGTPYCFLMLDESIPRKVRQNMLMKMCYVARGMNKEFNRVIGIATEKKIAPTCSYDFAYLDMPIWTDENQAEADQIQKLTGIFTDVKLRKAHEEEYPQDDNSR